MRSRTPGVVVWKVSHMSRAGWCGGMLMREKLYSSVSTSASGTPGSPSHPGRGRSRAAPGFRGAGGRENAAPGEGDIELISLQGVRQGGFFEGLAAGGKGRFERLLDLVGALTDGGALLFRDLCGRRWKTSMTGELRPRWATFQACRAASPATCSSWRAGRLTGSQPAAATRSLRPYNLLGN